MGQTWSGSSARSLLDALHRRSEIEVDDIAEDSYFPRYSRTSLRILRRAVSPVLRAELRDVLRQRCLAWQPDVLVVYKGKSVDASLIEWVRSQGIMTVNVFPDYSPHSYGLGLQEAIGRYDLVVSTKPFHPDLWSSLYGYANECVFVPHGYDPRLHLWESLPTWTQDLDVAIAASWRPQYESLAVSLGTELTGRSISVAVAGPGWAQRAARLPDGWRFPGSMFGRTYGEFVRRARIVVAPLHQEVVVRGRHQPGDVDTTRTYELAAAGCFFLHARTEYVQTVYDEGSEVPMWSDVRELAKLILSYLPDESSRTSMASMAHTRAVPAYSFDARVEQLLQHIGSRL